MNAVALISFAAAATAWAEQTRLPPEIRGHVLESGTTLPVAGAAVSLITWDSNEPRVLSPTERPNAVATTDAQGFFRFALNATGPYRISAQKEGYTAPGRSTEFPPSQMETTLTDAHPAAELSLSLGRPGQLDGLVVDAESDQPLSNVRVTILEVGFSKGHRRWVGGSAATTHSSGHFAARNLRPGSYVVTIAPHLTGQNRNLQAFDVKELSRQDRDYERAYWPGGSSLELALPVEVFSGATVNIGQVRVRDSTLYRVHVSVPDVECGAASRMVFVEYVLRGLSSEGSTLADASCGKTFLLAGFPPGHFTLEVFLNEGASKRRRARAELDITDKNLDISMALAVSQDVPGRIIQAELEGDHIQANAFEHVRVFLRPLPGTLFPEDAAAALDNMGRFNLLNKGTGPHVISITGLPFDLCVQEIRQNELKLSHWIADLGVQSTADRLEIVVSEKPGFISGTITTGGDALPHSRVAIVPWPVETDFLYDAALFASADEQGRFRSPPLAPGEYRLVGVENSDIAWLERPGVLERILLRASSLSVHAGTPIDLNIRSSSVR